MQHDDNDEYILTNPCKRISSPGDARINLFDSKLYQPSLREHLSTTTSTTQLQPPSLSINNDCHAHSPMAYPTSSYNSYFNSQTGTSVIHISSSNSVSSTVRENSNYIEKQWAMLKEKMLPTTKNRCHSEINDNRVLPELVEERCEVDFSFIDEPNGNELEDARADALDPCKSKFINRDDESMNTKSVAPNKGFSFANAPIRNHVTESLVSSFSSSLALSGVENEKRRRPFNHPESALKKDLCFDLKSDISNSNLVHSSGEKASQGYGVCPNFSGQNGGFSKSSLLVPSFKDEFLSHTSPILNMHLGKKNLKEKESQESPCVAYPHVRVMKSPFAIEKSSVNINSQPSISVPTCEGKSSSPIDTITNCAMLHDIQKCLPGREIATTASKADGPKSKRYQEMLSRKTSKKKQKELNTITSNHVPDYKGNDPLEEIINFINKDLKESSNNLRNNKKSKKKTQKKDCVESSSANGDVPAKETSSLEAEGDRDEKDLVKSKNDKKPMSDPCGGGLKSRKGKEKSDEFQTGSCNVMSQSAIQEGSGHEADQIVGSRSSFSDCESFSVVKKKKKIKSKPIFKSINSDSDKNSSNEGSFSREFDGAIGDSCNNGQSNKVYSLLNGNHYGGKQNIPCSESCNSIEDCHKKDQMPENPHKDKSDVRDPLSEKEADSVEVSSKQDHEMHKTTLIISSAHVQKEDGDSPVAVTVYTPSQNIWSSKQLPARLDEPIRSIDASMPSEETNEMTPKMRRVPTSRNTTCHSILLKSKSAFNLRHAQAFLRSTFQEVINSKGYVLYAHKED